jgi:hypothetical protein
LERKGKEIKEIWCFKMRFLWDEFWTVLSIESKGNLEGYFMVLNKHKSNFEFK